MDHNDKASLIENMLYSVLRALVDNPEAVKITRTSNQEQNTVMFGLSVDRSDLGKVIGKSGRNANSVRILMNAVAMKLGIRVLLDIDNMERKPEVVIRNDRPRNPTNYKGI